MKNFPPIGEAEGKREQVERMFDTIAPQYDRLNRVLSFGTDIYWRRKAVNWLGQERPRRILDVATGTADVALETMRLEPDVVVGVDIAEEMLRIGRQKVAERGLQETIKLTQADSTELPFDDDTFDGVIVAFGVRNFEDLSKGLSEFARVLRPGGSAVILEFSRPRTSPIKEAYGFYSRHVLPRIGSMLSGDSGAYEYLPESVAAFPDGSDFLAILRDAGFDYVEWKPMTFGIASLYKGRLAG